MTKAELYRKACMLPLLPGVYIIRDKSDTIIYIGKAKRLKTRVSQYFREGVPHDAKVTQMIAHAFTFDVIVCQSEFEALVLEASQIKAHTPKYNILLKDDKGYSYVKVTKGPWPRISAVLQKEDDDADYIGPFTSSFAVREMVEMAQDCFLLPRCNREFPRDFGKGRPCLNAHIGKCMAVCSGKISCEAYNDAVQGALRMIRYGKKDIVKQLREKMEAASDRLDFETAALLRDQIQAIERVAAGQKVVMDADTEMDVIALAGTTRAVAAMGHAAAAHPGAVFAVGNAPTALFALCDAMERGNFRPALVIGVPVGFVNVVESKELIMEIGKKADVPFIVPKGRKGGSNIAATICNAMLYQL